ncbi:MAG: helix-hairpin-helix domain-containing protein [Chloroflexota bacterium]|nr:helix-hairpin-helix domain-containing protein [Chloroflexota bacterium]
MPLNDRVLLAGIGGSLLLAAAAGWLLLSGGGASPTASSSPLAAFETDAASPSAAAEASAGGELLVDVEGGVAERGIQHLPAGSRVADAIFAAGGYGPKADLSASARQLNLAALLHDGEQVYVPQVGEVAAASPGSGGSTAGGPVNLNQASPEQLDALPGIGPVTVQKIVAARQERAFRSLDELVERKVLTTSQLAKIRGQVTV